MKRIEKLLKKIVKQSKDRDAKYWYGVEFSNHSKPDYRARVLFTKQNVQSLLFSANTEKRLEQSIDKFIKDGDVKDATIAYFEAQIELDKSSIEQHKRYIEEYKKKGSDETNNIS